MLLKIIFDTAAFLAGLEKYFDKVYTVQSVIDEVKDQRSKEIFELSLAAQKIIVLQPSSKSLNEVLSLVKKLSEYTLSKTDIEVVALALDFKQESIVYTDDLSLQNVLKHLGISYESVKLKGKLKVPITQFVYECINCHTRYFTYVPYCSKCGGRVIKKVFKH